MKATRFLPNYITLVVLTTYLLSASSGQAQTYSGQAKLADSPFHLEAAIYPVSNMPSTIKVSFNNRIGGTVRVIIRNQNGKVFYDEYESTALYRRRFDLSPLPEGNYTVELSRKNEQYTQSFAIEPPVKSHIAMENPPVQITPDKPADKKLVVSQ